MNVCVVNSLFPPQIGGSARGAFLLSEELSKRGHTVVVITSQVSGRPRMEEHGRIIIYRLRSMKYPKLEILHRADLYCNCVPGNFGKIVSILKKHRIDVVQLYGHFLDLTLMAVLACRLLRIPTVLTITVRMEHTHRFYDKLFLFLDKVLIRHLVARRVDRIVAGDKMTRDYVIERYGVDQQFVPFIPVAVDIARFDECDGKSIRRRYGTRDEDPVILSLGTISNLRSPVSLIKALLHILKDFPDTKLLLVGALYNTEAIRLVKKLGLESSVIFCGRIEYAMVPSYLGACDIEGHDLERGLGLGLASLEAMAAGKAVVSSVYEDNFIDLRLDNWRNIVLVKPRDVQGISRAVLRLLSDRNLRDNIGQNARGFVNAHFSLGAVCQRYEALYHQVMSQQSYVCRTI
jgi:glycosyltransferase involved in cell wall biosynthesis